MVIEHKEKIINFIRQLYNDPEGFIQLHTPVFCGDEKKYLVECIDSTFVSSVGKFVNQFEAEIERYTGANKAVACVNGTSALHLALKLVGVEPDNEVITQPLTFIATANAISYCGAHPVFLDIDKDTLGLSPEKLENWLTIYTEFNKITSKQINKTTKRPITACIPMHTFGHPCKIDEIVKVCEQFHIPVVEDAAESLGSFYKNQHTGTFGVVGILSFNGNKIITAGGGGILLFEDEKLAYSAKHLSTQAKVPHPWQFVHNEIGYNYRMPNINAALGLAQLEQLDTFLKSKRLIAEKYRNFFTSIDSSIRFISEPQNAKSNYWLNSILLKDKIERDSFLKYTNENGIMTRPAWVLMNSLQMFNNCETSDLKNAIDISERLVNIPSSVNMK